jgi:hypothetical protein
MKSKYVKPLVRNLGETIPNAEGICMIGSTANLLPPTSHCMNGPTALGAGCFEGQTPGSQGCISGGTPSFFGCRPGLFATYPGCNSGTGPS